MKPLYLYLLFTLLDLNADAQLFQPAVISSEISYESVSTSSKVAAQKPKNPGLIITSPAPLSGPESRTEYTIFRSIEAKTTKDRSTLTIKTTRIKNKKGILDIDTDNPFANDEFNKRALESYLSQIGDKKKIVTGPKGIISETNSGYIPGRLPLLHPVSELSGIFMNLNAALGVDQMWTDTLHYHEGTYINTYTVKALNNATTLLQLSGRLDPAPVLPADPSKDMDVSKLVQGGNIEAKTNISRFTYEGELLMDNNSRLISEMKLDAARDESVSVFGQVNYRNLIVKYTVVNKEK